MTGSDEPYRDGTLTPDTVCHFHVMPIPDGWTVDDAWSWLENGHPLPLAGVAEDEVPWVIQQTWGHPDECEVCDHADRLGDHATVFESTVVYHAPVDVLAAAYTAKEDREPKGSG